MLLLVFLAAVLQAEPARTPLVLKSPLQDKNFYFLTLLEKNAARPIQAAEPLRQLRQAKRDSIEQAAACKGNVACALTPFRWTADEIAAAGEALATPEIVAAVEREMRASGMFARWESMTGSELVSRAWTDAAKQMNRLLDVYGEGAKPRYGEIDAMAYDPKSPYWGRMTGFLAASILEEAAIEMPLFFQPPLRFALRLMEANHRDEAARYEPLHTGQNRAAWQRIRKIRWADYPYPVIIVPGSGTDRLSVALSPTGRERLRLAVRRYQQKKAPLILVSGGNVHPNQTPHNEAIEMKKSLMQEFGIPEHAILVEPHARHTTTNLRNAARLMWRYGIPFDKPALLTTEPFQSGFIDTPQFQARCEKEMGYVPFEIGKRLNVFDLEFLGKVEALHADAAEPLDP
ncbi:MAG: YdcF family protein [Bryobacterales bacterium]|nr:YdcF family protein [Bryobacterales bacterium]